MKNIYNKNEKKLNKGFFIDTSCETGLVAIYDGKEILHEKTMYESHKNSEFLPESINECLIKTNIKKNDLSFLCVGNGPGSFIGTRATISYAKGFCFGLNIKLFSISTMYSLAYSLTSNIKNGIVIMDAKSKSYFILEFYNKKNKPNQLFFPNEPKISPLKDLNLICDKKDIIIGFGFENQIELSKKQFRIITGPTGNGMMRAADHKIQDNITIFDEIYSCIPNYCKNLNLQEYKY